MIFPWGQGCQERRGHLKKVGSTTSTTGLVGWVLSSAITPLGRSEGIVRWYLGGRKGILVQHRGEKKAMVTRRFNNSDQVRGNQEIDAFSPNFANKSHKMSLRGGIERASCALIRPYFIPCDSIHPPRRYCRKDVAGTHSAAVSFRFSVESCRIGHYSLRICPPPDTPQGLGRGYFS